LLKIELKKETGIGTWTEVDFMACVLAGKGKNGQAMRYAMMPKTALDSAEVRAIDAYLATVPVLKNAVDRRLKK
jgi:hypothetical protein